MHVFVRLTWSTGQVVFLPRNPSGGFLTSLPPSKTNALWWLIVVCSVGTRAFLSWNRGIRTRECQSRCSCTVLNPAPPIFKLFSINLNWKGHLDIEINLKLAKGLLISVCFPEIFQLYHNNFHSASHIFRRIFTTIGIIWNKREPYDKSMIEI